MLIFPLIMNAIQFWLTDTILKVHELSTSSISNSKESTKLPYYHHHPPSFKNTKKESSYFSAPLFAVFIEQTERTPLIFPPSNNRMSS
ncbi:hypothetical protein HPULCUR_003967 [Helicostylum pulchrum]|uniref:Uncharacterized protein n=1 Tax=Helicostylum pulchrum TaxID=562976 RepID=A0ABP9XWZ0_9FUNG